MGDHEPSDDDLWREIVKIHNLTKGLFLLAEETDNRRFQTFIQPINEHRHAYEHTIRYMASKLGFGGHPHNKAYQRKSLNRALGHEYRAFFDCADWLSILLRERIIELTEPYDAECLAEALPDYFPTLVPRIDEICKAIAQIRGNKDIARKEPAATNEEIVKDIGVLAEIQQYRTTLEELDDIHKQILRAVPSFIAYRKKTSRSAHRNWLWTLIGALVATALCWGTSEFWGKSESGGPPEQPNQKQQAVDS